MDEFHKIEILKQELVQNEKEKSEVLLTIRSLKNEIRKTEREQISDEESASAFEYEVEKMLCQPKNAGMSSEDRWETRKANEHRLKSRQAEHHIERLLDSQADEERRVRQLDQKIDKIKSEINSINCQNHSSTSGYKPSSPKM